jgi:TolB-like protein/DNA-binding SARP family transcriptional activator
MLSLRLFGGPSLTGPDGPITGRANQRRRIAVLAVLAVARGRPVSRDKLVAMLWPEADGERARHLLADSVYVLRESLGDDVIVGAGDDLSLNAQRILSDTMEFDDALDAGERARAVAVHAAGGPFLDGVHLSDALEFERWVDTTRSQFTTRYRRALEELATEASARGDRAKAIEWWRMLAVDDRLSSRVALGLMRALADAGDRAGALEFAQVHEAVVRAELETAADPAVAAFAAELRAAPIHKRAIAAEPVPPPPVASAPPLRALAVVAPDVVTSVTPAATPDTRRPPRRWILVYAPAALILAAGIFGAARLRNRRSESIAVLPLDDISTDAADQSFAAGMTEELIASLAKIEGLRVIASTSTLGFKGHHTDVRRIADSLHVDYVLEGAWRPVGSRIRVNMRLVAASDGATRWSDSYDRDAKQVFEVQDDISRAVAATLKIRLLGAAQGTARLVRHQTTNLAAYDWYVHGEDQQLSRTESGARIAVDYFTRAIAADSTFAAAWAGLTHAYTVLARAGGDASALEPDRTMFDKAKAAGLRAVALDDSLVEAHANLSYLDFEMLDLAGSAAEARRALALDPHDGLARNMMAVTYTWMGRTADALAEDRRVLETDPLSNRARSEYARNLFYSGRDDDALAEVEKLRGFQPPLPRLQHLKAEILIHKRMWPEALAEAGSASPGAPPRIEPLIGYALAASGDRAGAMRVLSDLIACWRAGTGTPFSVATVYVGLGDYDQAFAWLDRAVDDKSVRLTIMGPNYARLRADPRFARIRERLGLQKL